MYSSKHGAIFCQLLKREWCVFSRTWKDTMFNSLLITSLWAMLYGYCLPALGMDYAYRVPLFIGGTLIFVVTIGYNIGMVIAQDLQKEKVTQYHLALPLPYYYVLFAYALSSMLKIVSITAPVMLFGLLLIKAFPMLVMSWGAFVLMTFLTLLMSSLLFLNLGIGLSFEMYLDNIWPRILAPIFTFSACFYTWGRLAKLSYKWSLVVLAGPFTYCAEGLRGAMLGGNDYIALPICCAVVTGLSLLLAVTLTFVVKQRLQLVYQGQRRAC